jgi:hypothetical protein
MQVSQDDGTLTVPSCFLNGRFFGRVLAKRRRSIATIRYEGKLKSHANH